MVGLNLVIWYMYVFENKVLKFIKKNENNINLLYININSKKNECNVFIFFIVYFVWECMEYI